MPILASVPLGIFTKPLNIISLNVLGGTHCSGVHPKDHNESTENRLRRYKRIAQGLAEGVKKQKVDVILLQETNRKDIVPALQEQLGKEWVIVVDKCGMTSCYNKNRLTEVGSSYEHNTHVRSFHFQDKANGNLAVNVHNIWGLFNNFPLSLERVCREKLLKNRGEVSVILGDTNSRLAPLDDKKRNLTTGLIPLEFNPAGSSPELQIPDYPDGGFYSTPEGEFHQLSTQVLDFASGEIVVDDRPQSECGPWPDYRMVMCLDDAYLKKKVIDNKNIFLYETVLKEALREPNLMVRMAADHFNNKAVAIRFKNGSYNFERVKQYLGLTEGVQFRNLDDLMIIIRDHHSTPYQCVFVPLDKVQLLHEAICFASPKVSVLKQLEDQIKKLKESHWYFRSATDKVVSLCNLVDQIIKADQKCSKNDLLTIIKTWENQDYSRRVRV